MTVTVKIGHNEFELTDFPKRGSILSLGEERYLVSRSLYYKTLYDSDLGFEYDFEQLLIKEKDRFSGKPVSILKGTLIVNREECDSIFKKASVKEIDGSNNELILPFRYVKMFDGIKQTETTYKIIKEINLPGSIQLSEEGDINLFRNDFNGFCRFNYYSRLDKLDRTTGILRL